MNLKKKKVILYFNPLVLIKIQFLVKIIKMIKLLKHNLNHL